MTLTKKSQQQLGQLLRDARAQAGLTQLQVANLIGLGSQYISNSERGASTVSIEVIKTYRSLFKEKALKWDFDMSVSTIYHDDILSQIRVKK